ncbi:unnamed protein product [Trichobilharzia szidati]|nr:unnamed protein product [Trichobilharzia szidati]
MSNNQNESPRSSSYQSEKLFQNESDFKSMVIKLVRSGDVAYLKLLVELINPSSSCTKVSCLRRLSDIKDHKQCNLVHIACKYGNKEMLEYLVQKLGLSVTNVDHSGNNPAHLILIYALKSLKSSSKKKRRKSSKCRVRNYIDCCELLKIVLHQHTNLLTISNKRGQKVTDLLQELWNVSSKSEREVGDSILKCILSDSHSPVHPSTSSTKPTEHDDEMYSFLSDSDEANYSSNEWEDYFSGFADRPFRSHLDSIREEYERRNRPTGIPNVPKSRKNSNTETNPPGFYDHLGSNNELPSRKIINQDLGSKTINISYEEYLEKWKEFINSDENKILNYHDILWPPFSRVIEINSLESSHIEDILTFVHHSSQALRQLQVDWHPDKFSGRFGTRFKSERVKNRVMKRVVNISQLLNKATDYLRNKEESV